MRIQCLGLVAAVCLGLAATVNALDGGSNSPVVIDFFYEPGCTECARVRAEVLPVLRGRFEGLYDLHQYDLSAPSNVARLVAYQQALDMTANEPVSMVIDYRHVFEGLDAIRDGAESQVEASVLARYAPDWRAPEPIVVPEPEAQDAFVAAHVRDIALATVIVGGLTDGINPCAISTLVFFMSLLAVAKVRSRGILTVGASFCLASFVTYTAIGLGLLHVLHTFAGFPALQAGVEIVMIAALLVLAWLSFRDAVRFHASGKPDDVTLQLPKRIKERIHRTMRTRLKTRGLVGGGLVTGAAVTALESVCTGQVYVPALIVVIKSGHSTGTAWGYLLLYNAMFVLPLVCVFLLTFWGLRTQALMDWSKRNVVLSKVLLGLFFAAMAVLIGLL